MYTRPENQTQTTSPALTYSTLEYLTKEIRMEYIEVLLDKFVFTILVLTSTCVLYDCVYKWICQQEQGNELLANPSTHAPEEVKET